MAKPFATKNGHQVPIKEQITVKSENFTQKLRVLISPPTSQTSENLQNSKISKNLEMSRNDQSLALKYLSNSHSGEEEEQKNEEFEQFLQQTPTEKDPEDAKNEY